jgi:hypothetical protein
LLILIWWWNFRVLHLSILTPLWLFKNKFRNLSKHICLLALSFFIEISFGNHPCQLGSFPPILKALLASDHVNQPSWGGRSKVSEQSRFSKSQGMRVLYHLSIHDPLIIMSRPQESRNEQMKYRLNLLLNSPCYNLTITVNSSDRWTPFVSVPRWYDAVASPCHLFPRPRSRHRDLTGWPLSSPVWQPPDRSASPYLRRLGWPLRFRWGIKGKPSRGVAIAKSCLLSNLTVSPLLFSPLASFGQPATSPFPLLLRSLTG